MASIHDFIDFTNQIDEREEIVDNDNCLNFYLRLTDDKYKALLERSTSEYNFEHLLKETDTTISATANLHKVNLDEANGKPVLAFSTEPATCTSCGIIPFCKGYDAFEKKTPVERDGLLFEHIERYGVCSLTRKTFTPEYMETPCDNIYVDISLVIEDDEAGWKEFNPVLMKNEKMTLINEMKRAAAIQGMNLIEAMKFSSESKPSAVPDDDTTADDITPEISKKNFVTFTTKDIFGKEHEVIIHKSNLPLLHMLLKEEPYEECRTFNGELEVHSNVIAGIKLLIHDSFEYLKLLDLLKIEYGKWAHETTLQKFLLERAEYIRCITGNPFDEDTGIKVYIAEIKGVNVKILNCTAFNVKEKAPLDKPVVHLGCSKFAVYAISEKDAIAAIDSL